VAVPSRIQIPDASSNFLLPPRAATESCPGHAKKIMPAARALEAFFRGQEKLGAFSAKRPRPPEPPKRHDQFDQSHGIHPSEPSLERTRRRGSRKKQNRQDRLLLSCPQRSVGSSPTARTNIQPQRVPES